MIAVGAVIVIDIHTITIAINITTTSYPLYNHTLSRPRHIQPPHYLYQILHTTKPPNTLT